MHLFNVNRKSLALILHINNKIIEKIAGREAKMAKNNGKSDKVGKSGYDISTKNLRREGPEVELNIPDADYNKPARKDRRRPRIGLALGSGVARGWAHIGVLRALERHGIDVDIVAGTSIGAVVGGCYVTGKLDSVEKWARSLTKAKLMTYMDFSMRGGGFIKGNRLVSVLYENLGDVKMEETDRPFVCVATDLVTGHEVWLRKGRIVDAIRASFALPGIFPPVWLDRWLIDGAMVNPVPVSVCRSLGARLTIAVNVNADLIGKARNSNERIPVVAGFDPLTMKDSEGKSILPEGKERKKGFARRLLGMNPFSKLLFSREPGAPSIFGVMVTTLGIIQDRVTRSRLAGDPPDISIEPRVGHIGLMEFDRAEELIEAGERAVESQIDEIFDALNILGISGGGGSHITADHE